jgi:hypothetical protein
MYAEADVYFPTRDEYQVDPGRWSGEDRMGLDRGTLNIRVSTEHPAGRDRRRVEAGPGAPSLS